MAGTRTGFGTHVVSLTSTTSAPPPAATPRPSATELALGCPEGALSCISAPCWPMWLRSFVLPTGEPAIGYEPHQRYSDENPV